MLATLHGALPLPAIKSSESGNERGGEAAGNEAGRPRTTPITNKPQKQTASPPALPRDGSRHFRNPWPGGGARGGAMHSSICSKQAGTARAAVALAFDSGYQRPLRCSSHCEFEVASAGPCLQKIVKRQWALSPMRGGPVETKSLPAPSSQGHPAGV